MSSTRLDAALLDPADDVATALFELSRGMRVRVACRGVTRDVELVERVPTARKFAVRDLGAGLRVRK